MPGLGFAGGVTFFLLGIFGLERERVDALRELDHGGLVALASTRRDRKPSKCRPLTQHHSAFDMATASSGLGS